MMNRLEQFVEMMKLCYHISIGDVLADQLCSSC